MAFYGLAVILFWSFLFQKLIALHVVVAFSSLGSHYFPNLNHQRLSSSSDNVRTCLFLSKGSLMEHKVQLVKPMGIILEEDDDEDESSSGGGVIVKCIDPKGATAEACRNENTDICVRDKILSINGVDCANDTFEDVMKLIVDASTTEEITLVLGRPSNAVVVRWSNGISVAAMPGDYFGQIAQDEAFVKIPYSCSNGGCGTCEQTIFSKEMGQRYIRPCVSRVPKGSKTIIVNPSDRYEPSS